RSVADGTEIIIPKDTYTGGMGENHGMGNVVIIDHDKEDLFSVYAHLASISVAEGARINAGQEIGIMGNTGTGDPPGENIHLHFELKMWGVIGDLHDDLGPEWGYTPNYPNLHGYINPWPYFDHDIKLTNREIVSSTSDQQIRTGPSQEEYTETFASAKIGDQFVAF